MSIKDTIKNSVIEGFNSDINTTRIVVVLGITIVIGLYIFFVYKYKSKSSFYSKDFNNVLAILPIITAGIILAMQSSIVISLGMVGALSIVRFRNAVKSPMDLLFLFWSISIGIIVGAGLFEIACIMSLFITILLFGLDYIPIRRKSLLLIIHVGNIKSESKLISVIKKYTKFYSIKSRSISGNIADYVIEIRTNKESELLSSCLKIQDVKNVNLIEHDGERRF